MKRNTFFVTVLVLLFAAGGILTAVMSGASAEQSGKARNATQSKQAKKEAENQTALQKEVKITLDQAREIALKKVPGKVEEGEIERENGKLIYSFDIRTDKDITEVQVNAVDGAIVAIEHEDAKKEAKEKQKEAREKASRPSKK